MEPAGWAMMIVSISFVLVLVTFCISRVLALPPREAAEHLKAPIEINTGDAQNAD